MKQFPERIVIRKEPTKRKGGWRYLLQCKVCAKHFWYPGYEFNFGRGQYCCLECANNSTERIVNLKKALPLKFGSSNPNWKGGISPTQYQRHRKDYCEKCGKEKHQLTGYKREPLNVHHKDHNRKNNNANNLITLCEKCHKAEHPR